MRKGLPNTVTAFASARQNEAGSVITICAKNSDI